MTARVAPASPPFEVEISELLEKTMRGAPPLRLFTTLAIDPRLFKRFFASGLLDKGNLTLRQREIVIDRTTALCGSEYEWGVHVALFAERVGLTDEQVRSTVLGSATDSCWTEPERLLIRLCDALHRDCNIDDALWHDLTANFSEACIIEMLMLAGFYRTVSYLTNGLKVELEDFGVRFPG
ncbi:MAG: carboxymuconolactone decarboxylase family protein [Gammaproteobacteria bacterium]